MKSMNIDSVNQYLLNNFVCVTKNYQSFYNYIDGK